MSLRVPQGSGQSHEGAERVLVDAIVPDYRELFAEELADAECGEGHDALGADRAPNDRGRGRMALVRPALDDELGLDRGELGLDADARDVTGVETAFEARAEADHDRGPIRALHAKQHTARLGRRERLHGLPAQARREPPQEQQRLRGVYVAAVHVDSEPDANTGHTVEERPP